MFSLTKDVEGLIVAKIDGTANEVQGVEVKTLKLL